jgi:hypothetical protein
MLVTRNWNWNWNWNGQIRIINRHDYSDFPTVNVIRTLDLVHVEDEFSENAVDDGADEVEPRGYLIWLYRDSLRFHRTPNDDIY